MIQNKYISVIVIIVTALAVILTILMIGIANSEVSEVFQIEQAKEEYGEKIFGADIISIEIIADEADWTEMLLNAEKEEFISADVIVNGIKFEKVGIRPKGNSSLTQVASSDSDRYSFRLKFDEYIDGQTCFGLESFVVNNMIGDNTYMKEYISYDLMKEAGVDAPYFNFAKLTINGENGGLYLAVELYNDSYEERIFATTEGMLYNVKSMEFPDNMEFPMQDFRKETEKRSVSQNRMERGGIMRGFGNSGGTLAYNGESSDNYSAIFENAVGKSFESDYQRVITALKNLSEGENLEKYFEVDKILRYLAAHTIVVNLDSYSSGMAQNYYLYEKDGKVTILPWDYNLAWGGFQSKDASGVVNFPIDTPVNGVTMEERPLIAKLLEQEEYKERYHQYMQELIDSYFKDGKWNEKISQLYDKIKEAVKNDETAFCTYEEFEISVPVLKELGNLRAESITGQLDGSIPSTKEGQELEQEKLVDASYISLSDLGSMTGGKRSN